MKIICSITHINSFVLSSGHLLTHTGEKKHQCTTCGKRFTKAHHLKSHINTHLKHLGKQNAAQPVVVEETTPVQIATTKADDQDLINVVYM